MPLKRNLGILVLIIVHSVVSWSQHSAVAKLDTNEMLIGDHRTLRIEATSSSASSIQLPDLKLLDTIETIELLGVQEERTNQSNGQLLVSQEATFTVFDSGAWYIPPLPVRFEGQDSKTLFTQNLLLIVDNPPQDTIELAPIKNIVAEPLKLEDWLPYIAAVLGVLLIIGLYYWLKSRRKKEAYIPAPPPPLPSHEIALNKLRELRKAQLWQAGEIKAYHSQLSFIVREYLEGRYGIQALESTTGEILKDLRSKGLPQTDIDQVQRLLQSSDLVKFAKAQPPASLHEQFLDEAEQFVIRTKLVLDTPPDAQNLAIPLILTFGEQYSLASPWFLLMLPLVLLIAWWYYKTYHNHHIPIRWSSFQGVDQVRSLRSRLIPLLPILRIGALLLFVIALARPQKHSREEKIKANGIDIMLVIDLSSSMLARDFRPDRLETTKSVAADFIRNRPYDRIGLAVFAGEAFTQCPLTTDHRVVQEFLANLKCGLLEDGTAIGMGLATAVNRMKDGDAETKVVILLTDGDNNAGYVAPLTAAEIAREFDVKVYTIGVGSRGKALAPVSRRSSGEYIFGMTAVRIDEELLRQISQMTEGKYYRAASEEELQTIYDEIDQLEKTEIDVTVIKRNSEEFHWFVFLGLLLLGLELLLKNTWLRTGIA